MNIKRMINRYQALQRGGFSLIELIFVIAILGTLSAIAIPNFISYRERGKVVVAVVDIRFIEKEISAYRLAEDEYPDDLDGLSSGKRIDPWGNPYRYLRIDGATKEKGKGKGKGGVTASKGKMRKDHFMVPVNSDYDLYSMGRDGKSVSPFTAKASRDDVVRVNNGRFVGLVSDY